MKIRILIFLVLFSSYYSFAQNLVPNPSFEKYSTCPNNYSQVYFATPWFQPNIYYGNTSNSSSSDYFNSCTSFSSVSVPSNRFGYQYPHTGLAYAGIACFDTNNPFSSTGREYLEVQLIDTLKKGEHYSVTFYVSPGDNVNYAIDAIGAYLSKDKVIYNDYWYSILPFNPQIKNTAGNVIIDSTNWTSISGEFIAQGGEKFITIGNFSYDSLMTVDTLKHDHFNNWSYYYIDDVSVSLDSGVGIEKHSDENNISIYPNPSDAEVYVEANINSSDNGSLEVMNIFGQSRRIYQLNSGFNHLIIPREELSEGVYLFKTTLNESIVKYEKVVVIR